MIEDTPNNEPDFLRLSARPIEDDTTIFLQQFHRFGKIPVLLELWGWDHIVGQSAVLLSADVQEWTDERLVAFVGEGVHTDLASATIKRLPGFTFINYGFEG